MPPNNIPGSITEDVLEESQVSKRSTKMPKRLAPLGKERMKDAKVNFFLEFMGVTEILLGVLVIVLNILVSTV